MLHRLRRLTGTQPTFERLDVRDTAALERVLADHKVAAVVHFAAYKAVGESTARPLEYYDNNVGGLLSLCKAMRRQGCCRLVFSSSATVYGDPQSLPLREDAPLSAVNPYGETKLVDGLRAWFQCVVFYGFFHGDVHAGNLMLLDDDTIGFLDFGIVGRFDDKERYLVTDYMIAFASGNYKRLAEIIIEMGGKPEGLDMEAYRAERLKAFVDMLRFMGLARPPVLPD